MEFRMMLATIGLDAERFIDGTTIEHCVVSRHSENKRKKHRRQIWVRVNLEKNELTYTVSYNGANVHEGIKTFEEAYLEWEKI